MGKRGPKPRPTVLYKRLGNYRADRHGHDISAPGVSEPPATLTAPERERFHELVSILPLPDLTLDQIVKHETGKPCDYYCRKKSEAHLHKPRPGRAKGGATRRKPANT
jgi:hypothetical protein